MKRILSAVTSLTMGISILTSAFAVPFSTYAVSEASSFAEQSVITANDKVAAKNASSADALQWSIDNVKQASYKAGDVIYVDVFVTNAWGTDPDKEGIRGLQAFIDYDKSAFELVEIGESCYGATESSIASAGITVTLSNSTGLGTIAEKGDTVTYFGFKVKSGAKDGTYPITWVKDDTVVTIHPGGGDDNVPPTLADVDLVDGSIILGDGGSVVTTTAKTTTKPDTPSTGKLQWSLTDVTKDTYKAGDVIYVDAFVTNAWGSDPDKEGIRGLQAFIDYDKSTFELVEIGDSCYGAVESSIASAGITVTLSNSTGLGTIAKKGDTVTYFGFKVKDGAKDGTYPITWVKDDTVVTIHPGGGDDNVPPTLADVDLVDGSITLGSGGSVVTTTAKTTTKATTTKPNTPVGDKLQWSIGNEKYTDDMGSDIVYVPVNVTRAWGTDPDTQGIRGLQGSISYDETALELVEISASSCYGNAMVNLDEKMFITTFSNASGLGTIAKQGDEVTYFGFKIKSGAKPGVYPIKWDTSYTSATIHPGGGDDNVPPTLAELDLVDGSIEIVSSVTPGVTTTAVTQSGEIGWVIPTVTAKPGDTVTMDVTVDGTDVAVAGYEGGIAHAAGVDYAGVASGSAYDAETIDNGESLIAFATPSGLNKKAADGSTVFTLKYTVPENCKAGKYPITWENALIVDENGNDITSLINLVDGAIVVEGATTTAVTQSGEIGWIIPTVTAKPGDTVTMDVTVDGTDVAVAGYEGGIAHAAGVDYAGVASGSAYDAEMVDNGESLLAFATPSGLNKKAADGSTVFTLKYTVPENCKAGKYPITWANAWIVDENGNDITSLINLVDGAIIIEDATTTAATTAVTQSGEIGWVIPTVTAKPGDTVTMDVTVDGTDVAVAGYEGGIAHAAGVDYAGVASGDAYGAEMIDNGEKLLAFATPDGLNKIAAEKATVFTLTYNVPDDCKAGKYPITWENAFIVDENGNDITSLINLIDGAIIIEDVVTTASQSSVTATTTTTAATSSAADTSTTVTTTTKGSSTTTAATTVSQSGSTATTTSYDIPDGEIGWVIPTVTAKPGDTVKMNVFVEGTDVAVAGYEGAIAHAAGVDYAGVASGDAYGAEMIDNGEKLLAFATPDGLNKIAAEKATVFTLTYNVPDDCKAGKYPITWENAFIVDENGNDITSLINLIDGAIIIEDVVTTASQSSVTATTTTTAATSSAADTSTTVTTTTKGSSTTTAATTVSQSGSTATTTSYDIPDGEIGWVIPTVTAKPGDTVKMNVFVEGTDVAVAGYEGAIAHAAGVDYAGVASGDAYGAEMIDNGEKLLAFATPDGLNKIAAEKATVFTLTYNVPDDCKAGKYPITWENAFIVDENGNDITSLINLIDGAIIIEDVVTTASQSSVTATTTTTAATSSTADTSTIVATTTKSSSTTTAATTVSQSGSTATVTATTPQNSSTTTAAKTTSGVVSTTTAATTSNGGSATTTGIVIPADAIGWIIPTVTAAPGQTVSMNVYVKGNAVGVAGMEGAVNWTSPIGFSGISDRSEAYDADVIYNPEENLIAFGRANGLNKIAEDGSYVFTLTYTVPEDCASGKYPITWDTANTFISDENGNKVPVVLVDGAIIVTPKTTTQQDGSTTTVATTSSVVSTTTVATTTPDVVSSTTAATTTPDVASSTTATATTPVVVSSTTAATTTPGVVSTTTAATTTPSVVSSTTAATTTPGVVSTTPAATTSQGGSVTTTAISIPTDTIGWVIPTVTAVPGQTVTMNVYVKGSSVGVAGMEGIINWTSPIGFSGISDRSEAYDADVVYNPEENIIAFGRNSGLNKIAEDGSYVFTLTYTVPEDCESGIYPVSWDSAKTYISDENGNKVPVVLIDGAIIVSPKTTTATTPQGGSTTTVTATTPQGGSTTTVTETTPSVVSTTTASATTPSVVSTTTASATTPQGGSTTTASATTPQGGSTTTVTATTPQGGSTTTASATTPQGGSTTTASATTPQGGSTTTASATTPQGGSTTTASATTPQGGSTTTASATTPQGGSTTTVTVTTPQGGSTTTTTGPVSPGTGTATSMIGFFAIDSEIETTYGFYFSHDTNEFNKGQIIKVIAHCTFQKEDGTIEESDVDLTADIGFNGQTPYSMFKKSLGNVYEVPLYYGDEPLTYEDGSPVTVLALIGVKGDADLNNTVDAIDASNVLTYYAQKQTGVESPVLYQGPTDVLKGVNEKFGNVIKGLDQVDVLDELACFLADVDVDEYSADNWKTHKGNRAIDAIDASNILSFYAKVQTGSPADSATWDEVLGR